MDGTLVTALFNSPTSYCINCERKLQYPITSIANTSVCESCVETYSWKESEENIEFHSAVMKHLLIPCKYSYRGCAEKASFSIISLHERKCEKRDKICPFYELKKCSHADHLPNIAKHFFEFHPSHIRTVDGNSIELTYEVNDELNEFWMLAFKDDNVLLNVKVKCENLFFILYCVDSAEDVTKLKCKITHHNGDICTRERICHINPEKELGIDENEKEKGIIFNREMLENYFGHCMNTTLILEKEIFNITNDEILAQLECPVCNNFMRLNIKLCSAGHSVCNECQSKLDKCPICTLRFTGARNYALESIGDLLKVVIRGEKFECPLWKELECPWKGTQSDILEHVKDVHGDKIELSNHFTRILTYSTEFTEVNYLMAFAQVFKITCRKDIYDDVMVITIELIGHDEDAQKYNYNISLNTLYKQNIIWYTKSKIFARRRIEYHIDYIAIGRIVCNNQLNISYVIVKNYN